MRASRQTVATRRVTSTSLVACVVAVCCLAACLRDSLVECLDGRLCPAGTLCDDTHRSCVAPAQTTACSELDDGDVCIADNVPGICDASICLPGCGDGVQATGEECDDGNFRSHDGCSSRCLVEAASWRAWSSLWKGRDQHTVAYDPDAALVMIVGGSDGSSVLGEHWTLDLSGKMARLAQAPPARRGSAIAYDSIRKRTVLFGGFDVLGTPMNDTWEWDGQTWSQIATPASPMARGNHAMAFDRTRGRLVLHGGGQAGFVFFGDTWEYDGATWQQKTPVTAPGVRQRAAMAWSPARDKVVLYGGVSIAALGDTWEYDGERWTSVPTAEHPPGSDKPSVAYDSVGSRTIAFDSDGTTWAFNSGSWSCIATDGPGPRRNASLVFNPDRSRMTLIGGVTSSAPVNDVWELDGDTWTEVDIIGTRPVSRENTSVVADRNERALLMFGGASANRSFGDTWLLQFRSITPDEVCGDGVDNDGDRQADPDDPDCI